MPSSNLKVIKPEPKPLHQSPAKFHADTTRNETLYINLLNFSSERLMMTRVKSYSQLRI